MIEINLVPEPLRKKKKRANLVGGGVALPKEIIIGVIGGVLAILLVTHIVLQFMITVKFVQHKGYNNELNSVAAQKAVVDKVISGLKDLRERVKAVDTLVSPDRTLWSQKLNEISDELSRGVWLSRITLDGDTLLIQGTAVSKNKSEMIDVHNFTANLKKSEAFMKNVDNVELGLIKSRRINETSVADFTIITELKE